MKNFFVRILWNIVATLARVTLKRFKPRVVAITGSVGKTSSKEAIFAVLSQRYKTRRSRANFNNELGVPLTIISGQKRMWRPAFLFWTWVIFVACLRILCGLKRFYSQMLVLEYGADKAGDISYLLDIAKPSIAVISGIGAIPVHVENYAGGIDAVVREKGKLISGLSTHNHAVLNGDDAHVRELGKKTRGKITTYGFGEDADIRIINFAYVQKDARIEGISFKLEKDGVSVPVSIKGAFSLSHAYALACAASVASLCGIHLVEAGQALCNHYAPSQGRSVLLDGIKHTQLIDESYNSSPVALEAALTTLSYASFRRRVAIVGDMLELGEYALKAHEAMGSVAHRCVDILVTIGPRARFIAKGALKNGMTKDEVFSFETTQEAEKEIEGIIREGDLILVKGSRAMGLEGIVKDLIEL